MNASIENGLVLVVDDVEVNRILAQAYLELLGWRVRTAESGPDALLAMRDQLPEAMLVDMRMPGMSGQELARILKGREETEAIRLVGYTAHALPDELSGFLGAGFDDVLIKPALMPEMRRVFGERA